MTAEVFIGVDIGGGSTKLGLVSAAGVILARQHIPNVAGAPADAILKDYTHGIAALLRDANMVQLGGIGVGFPGHIAADGATGTNSNVAALDGVPVAAVLSRHFGCKGAMINDADAGAMAEHRFGAGQGVDRLLLVTVGTGVGVSLVVGGAPLHASNGCLGDAGHIILVADDPVCCRQGCLGCLESVASGAALDAKAQRLYADAPKGGATVRLLRHALAGQTDATAMIAEAGRWIGMAAATWCNIFAPGRVLIGGGISAVGSILVDAIRQEAQRRTMPYNIKATEFALAGLGNDAGMIGAASVVMP